MKSKRIITLAFILVILMQCQTTIAQLLHPITFNVIRQNSTEIYCETNYIAQKSTPTLVCKLEIHVVGDVVSPTFDISTTKNESIVKIARTLTDERKKIYATYTLSNKEKITLDTYGHDSTKEGLKKTKNMGGLRFFSVFVRNGKLSPATVAKFRSYDIETINLGTGVVDVKKTLGINTASIINSMCKKLIEKGVNAETLGENYVVKSKSNSSSSPSSNSSLLSTSKNKSAIQLILNPFGVIDSENINLTGPQIIGLLNQYKGWKAEINSDNLISVSGYSITWNGFPLDPYMFATESVSYGYSISVSSESEGIRVMNNLCKELGDGGLLMNDVKPDKYLIVDKEGTFAHKRIHISLDKWKNIRIRIYNK